MFMKLLIIQTILLTETSAFNGSFLTKSKNNAISYPQKSAFLFPQPRHIHESHRSPSFLEASSAALNPPEANSSNSSKLGFFSFKTKYGYLNPFAIYYGVTSILLGIPWFFALLFCQLLYAITGNKVDKFKRLPTFFSHVWGTVLLRLTRSYPEIEGKEILDKFFKENRAAMLVANHNAWMDIPFIGITAGWRNYKMVSKVELGKVPILGRSIKVGGHVMVDRSSRKSQLMTLKTGMGLLKDGIHLVTFPEGTRSKTGRLLAFKNGAFKMAHKAGAPVIPLSIVHANMVNPPTWMFPRRASRGVCKVIVHEPIESSDKSEKELADAVRKSVIEGLPEDQRPLE